MKQNSKLWHLLGVISLLINNNYYQPDVCLDIVNYISIGLNEKSRIIRNINRNS